MRIFKISSLIAYMLGVILSYQSFASIIINGSKKVLGALDLYSKTAGNFSAAIPYIHVYGVSLLILICLRFYIHADGINDPIFFEQLAKKTNGRFESILRGCWVLLALNFPIIIAIPKLFQTGSEQTLQETAQLVIILFDVLAMMYLAMVIWCRLYIDVVIAMSSKKNKGKGINEKNMKNLTYPDYTMCIFTLIAAFAAHLLYSIDGNLEAFPIGAVAVFSLLFIVISIQIISFFFNILIEKINSLVKSIKETIEIRY